MTHTGARWWPWAAAMELETHAGVAPTLSHSEARKVDDGILVACGLAVGAGSIHIAAGIEHLHDYALHSAFFWLLAAGQIGLGVALSLIHRLGGFFCPALSE